MFIELTELTTIYRPSSVAVALGPGDPLENKIILNSASIHYMEAEEQGTKIHFMRTYSGIEIIVVKETYDEVKELIKKGRNERGLTYTTLDDLGDPPRPPPRKMASKEEEMYKLKESRETGDDKPPTLPWKDTYRYPLKTESLEEFLKKLKQEYEEKLLKGT